MTALFSTEGIEAVCRLAASASALVFDLDGSLAPLPNGSDDARLAPATSARLQRLSRVWPVAVISGRQVADSTQRLGFKPQFLFGNHGAERAGVARPEALVRSLEPCRKQLRLRGEGLADRGIAIEDKGLSLALDYHRCADRDEARAWLDSMVAGWGPGLRATHGHSVLNVTPQAAPDKGDALLEVMRECGASQALVVGDDGNDEAALERSPPGSVSVRIGPPEVLTQARFRLARQSQVESLITLLLALRR